MSNIFTSVADWFLPDLKTISQEGEREAMSVVQAVESDVKAVPADVKSEYEKIKDGVQEAITTLEADALKAIADFQEQAAASKTSLMDFRDRLSTEITSKQSALLQVENELTKLISLMSGPAKAAPAASSNATSTASGWTNPPTSNTAA